MPPATSATARPLWIFATLWSLRQYPTLAREWRWPRKFAAIRAAGFTGVFSPPRPELAERGDLRYLAVTSLDRPARVKAAFTSAAALGALAIDVQLGDYNTPLRRAVALARRIDDVSRELGLPYAIETHRDTFTETPEATTALCRAFRRETSRRLPLCLDHSHFAVVRHLAPDTFWDRLRQPRELLRAATQYHLRPFNGHHCQIPVLDGRHRRTPEYQAWLVYAAALFDDLARENRRNPVLVVPELGHAAPAYGLSCFGDTWRDLLVLHQDLRTGWRKAQAHAALRTAAPSAKARLR